MKKKFSFNFKFLDRFKKKSSTIEEHTLDSIPRDALPSSENDEDLNYEETEENTNRNEEYLENKIRENKAFLEENLNEIPEAINENDAHLNEMIQKRKDQLLNHDSKLSESDHSVSFENLNEIKNPNLDDILKTEKVKNTFRFFSFKDKFENFGSKKEITSESSSTRSKKFDLQKFEWTNLVIRFFSPYNRHRIHAFFLIVLFGTLTYLTGKAGALLLGLIKMPETRTAAVIQTNIEVKNTSSEDISKVSSNNLFRIKNTEQEEKTKTVIDIDSIVCLTADKPSSVSMKLMDTVVLQDSVKSVASVQHRGSQELLNVREGERIDQAVEVSKINRLNVVLKNLQTGACEYIGNMEDEKPLAPNMKIFSPSKGKPLLNTSNPEIKSNGNNFKITKNYRNKMLANINQILTEAKAIQITNPDGTLCYKMTEVVAGSLYTQLNIQENDIICQINGKKIENLNELMTLLGRLKEIDQFQLGVKRNGMNENLEYNFE